MHAAANTNLFFTDVFSFKGLRDRYIIHRAEVRPQIVVEIAKSLYQQNALLRAADRFCQIADNAYAFRRMDVVEELGEILINAPLPRQYESIGQYYQALSICRKLGVVESRPLFERVIDEAPLAYRARAMVSLGTTFVQTGDLQAAKELYADALRASRNNWADSQTIVLSHKMTAVAKSIDGDQRGALEDLERLLPLARMVGTTSPQVLYDYLNGYAVELCEANRLQEANNISRIVLASPYINAYPEWRETSNDIERKAYRSSRSFVPLTQGVSQHNILRLPERENTPISQGEPGRVLYYDWQNMAKKQNNESDEALDAMDEKDLLVKLLQMTAQEDVDRNKLLRIVKFAVKVMSEK
jgi:tetratricopeptide (TPR) repeat protein